MAMPISWKSKWDKWAPVDRVSSSASQQKPSYTQVDVEKPIDGSVKKVSIPPIGRVTETNIWIPEIDGG